MRYSILIVDTDENIHKYLRSSFIKDSYIIHSVNSAEEALMMIASHQIDIIISEIALPGINGIELLTKVKKVASSIEFIFLTHEFSSENLLKALQEGASDFINKSTNLEQTPACIKKIIKKHETKKIKL